jgi:hypothetical protein
MITATGRTLIGTVQFERKVAEVLARLAHAFLNPSKPIQS